MGASVRAWHRVLAGAFALLMAAGSGVAAAATKAAEVATLPSPLTPEAVRELVSRLSDEEVRRLLVDQLDKAAAKSPVKDAAKADMGMLGMVEHQAGTAREGAAALAAAVGRLPAATRSVADKLVEPDGAARFGWVLVLFAVVVAGGLLAELLLRRLTRTRREELRGRRADGLLSGIVLLLLRLLLEIAYVAVFGAVALVLFLAFWQGHEMRRILLLGLLGAIVVTRLMAVFADFLLAPARPDSRLLPLDDATAATFLRAVTAMTALWTATVVTRQLYLSAGADFAVVESFALLGALAILILALATVWRVRRPIGDLIRGAGGGGPLAGWVADLWPIAAMAYLLAVFAGRLWEMIAGADHGKGEGALSLLIVLAMPVVDYGLSRALTLGARNATSATPSVVRHLTTSYEPALRRLIHILVVAFGVLALGKLWNLDLFGMAERSLGGQIASALLGIGLVLLVAYILWEIARTAIDGKLANEAGLPADAPASRLRTLLPLLRIFIAITLVVMTVLSVLAALGVNIVPLLAGASIVGVAIGFGSQTLVRDIVSGAFFLMDDAFRVGEYIEVGDAKGTVEKITVRALFLRHHRGALNILPYGQISRLRNTSRDWMIMILEFRLALETDLRKVKKIVKTIADEIAADEEVGPALLSPIKSGGVTATDDSSITVRIKYMVKPGDAAFMIRRMAYEKILRAFKANGIEFASRRVAVYVPPGEERNAGQIAAAALPAIEAAAARDGKTP